MRINQQMLLAKFVVGQTSLVLELDYRVQHPDVEVIRGLVSLIYSNAEDHYAKLFRFVSGDDVLQALEDRAPSLASLTVNASRVEKKSTIRSGTGRRSSARLS